MFTGVVTAAAGQDDHSAGAWPLGARDVVVSVVALLTIGLAQPLLDVLGRNAAFLVAHDATALDVVLLAVGLTVILPLAAAAAILGLKRISAAAAAALHAALLAVLGAVLILVIFELSGLTPTVPGWLAVLLAAAGGAGVAYGYGRSARLRRLLIVGVVAAPAVVALFLFATPASALVLPAPTSASTVEIPADAPPIVIAVFDELPVATLLTGEGVIDAAMFPSFARFAEDATFFRNTTSVHGQTSDSVPSMLTGEYPRPDALPVAGDHPENLFAVLSGAYDLHVTEALTELCPPGRCRSAASEGTGERYATLARDLAIVGSHLVLPEDLAQGLPPIDQGWRDFRGAAAEAGKEGAVLRRFRDARQDDPAPIFERFVAEVERTSDPTLHFMHTLLPHSPWSYLADGRRHSTEWYASGFERGRWTDDTWRVAQAEQRHIVQTQLADRLLGLLLDRLQAEDMYDDALVVVVADHGASLAPGTSMRAPTRETFGEIAPVPFLVKPPGQQHGEISDRPLELVDVFPTILDVIGAPVPDGIDGRSAFDRSTPERTSKRFFTPSGQLIVDASGDEKWPVVARKEALFRGGGPFEPPFNLAPRGHAALLGADVRRLAPASSDDAAELTVALDAPALYAEIDTTAHVLPALLQGSVSGVEGDAPILAVAVNGSIAAVTRADLDGGGTRGFRVLLPPTTLKDGRNSIEVFVVEPGGVLRRIPAPS